MGEGRKFEPVRPFEEVLAASRGEFELLFLKSDVGTVRNGWRKSVESA